MYAGTALCNRIFYADIHSFKIYALFCLVHGGMGLLELLFLYFKDELFKCISLNILEKDALKF